MNQDRETIFIDVDETLARTIEDGVYPIVNSIYGTNLSFDTTTNYRDVFGNIIQENGESISLKKKIEIFKEAIAQDIGKNIIRPVSGSVQKILDLSKGYNLGMLTARHPDLIDYTTSWAKDKFNGTISKILSSNCYHGGKVTKIDICKQEGVKIMIEDDIDYALELAKGGVKVFLLEKPWNIKRKETHKNIIKVNGWEDIQI